MLQMTGILPHGYLQIIWNRGVFAQTSSDASTTIVDRDIPPTNLLSTSGPDDIFFYWDAPSDVSTYPDTTYQLQYVDFETIFNIQGYHVSPIYRSTLNFTVGDTTTVEIILTNNTRIDVGTVITEGLQLDHEDFVSGAIYVRYGIQSVHVPTWFTWDESIPITYTSYYFTKSLHTELDTPSLRALETYRVIITDTELFTNSHRTLAFTLSNIDLPLPLPTGTMICEVSLSGNLAFGNLGIGAVSSAEILTFTNTGNATNPADIEVSATNWLSTTDPLVIVMNAENTKYSDTSSDAYADRTSFTTSNTSIIDDLVVSDTADSYLQVQVNLLDLTFRGATQQTITSSTTCPG